MVRYYPAIVEPTADGFGLFFPDIPGCTSAGATVCQAVQNAQEALLAHLALVVEHGEAIPSPSSLRAVALDPEIIAAARVLIRAEAPGRT